MKTITKINDFLELYIGEDWKDLAIQSMLIGFGIACLVYLFTVTVCSRI